jgi:hypothetical protein
MTRFEVTDTPATFFGPVLGFTPVVDICCHNLPPAELLPLLDTDSSSLNTLKQPGVALVLHPAGVTHRRSSRATMSP